MNNRGIYNMSNAYSVMDKLLIASLVLVEKGKKTFSAEDLVVMAWRKYPETFGLTGYCDENGSPQYPNSNRVYVEIMGSKPLRKKGYLRKVGPKIYELTEAGRIRAQELVQRSDITERRNVVLAREQVKEISSLFSSRAAKKSREEKNNEISFFDACGFWGISPRSNAKQMWDRFAQIEAILNTAIELASTFGDITIRHGISGYTTTDLEKLLNLHMLLKEQYKEELTIIKRRADER